MEEERTVYQMEWQGIAITITHRKTYPINDFSHIEVQANQRLPMTETGYKSHFMPNDALSEYDGVVDFVIQWLEATCQSKEWKRHVEDMRQPSLFDFD